MDPKKQKDDMPPLYVIGKNKEKNELIVGRREETRVSKFVICNVEFVFKNYVGNLEKMIRSRNLFVRIRNLGELVVVSKIRIDKYQIQITVAKPLYGVAEGQSAVIYDTDGIIVGGGIIAN